MDMDSAAAAAAGPRWPLQDEFSVPELGATFSPFQLMVEDGEDILEKIMSLTGPDQGVCVLVAKGCVSSFSIKLPGASSPWVYQEMARILRLQGLYLPMEKGAPLSGRLKFVAGLVHKNPKSAIQGDVDVCGQLICKLQAEVSLGIFKVDFEKLQHVDRARLLEAAPPIVERQRVPSQPPSTSADTRYVPYVGGPPPPKPTPFKRAVPPPQPRSDWQTMCINNEMLAASFLPLEPLVPPYLFRHLPPPPPPTTAQRIEQLEKDSAKFKDRIQRLEQDKVALREEIQQLKQEFRAMVQLQQQQPQQSAKLS